MRVLIVEDDAGIASGLAATLKSSGYAVDVTPTLALATAALRVEPFDLVLLDLGLPDGDGLDWLRAVRQSGQVMPVLIMTARDSLPDRVAGLDEGADDYVVKPFEPEELMARMRVALRRSRGAPPPPEGEGTLLGRAATLGHWALYALMLLMPVSGLVAWFGGVETAGEAHEVMSNLMLFVVAVNVAAALWHQLWLKDHILLRMMRAER
jgi:DNA-binding response OmpR family regulator